MLPYKEAIHLPFVLYGRVKFDECVPYSYGGGICRISQERLKFNSWQIGYPVYHLEAYNLTTKIIVKGALSVGERGRIYNGVCLIVRPDAELRIGTGFSICSYSRLICYNNISIGNNVIISWECQIFDTNFHYIVEKTGDIQRKDGLVIIGNDIWIANRVTITKGAGIPNNSIVAGNSLVNKDFSNSESGLYAGVPAKLTKSGCRAEFTLEGALNDYFKVHPEVSLVNIKIFQ